jgi:hypothetical protein
MSKKTLSKSLLLVWVKDVLHKFELQHNGLADVVIDVPFIS